MLMTQAETAQPIIGRQGSATALWLRRHRWIDRLSPWIITLSCIFGVLTFVTLTAEPPFGGNPDMVFWLLNIDLILLILCSVLVIRRIARLSVNRRKGMAGSRLHIRLVVIFSLLAAVPAVVTAVFSIAFFHVGLQGWFSERVKTAVTESQAVAEAYLQEHQQIIRADILAMTADLQRQRELLSSDPVALERMLKTQAFLRNLPTIIMLDDQGQMGLRIGEEPDIALAAIRDIAAAIDVPGEVMLLPMSEQGSDARVRSLTLLEGYGGARLYASRPVDPKVLGHLRSTREGVSQYRALEGQSAQFQASMTLIFVVVTLVLMLAAVWFALMLARRLVTPISGLVQVSERLRSGDLDARVGSLAGIEEFDILGESFNRMSEQLKVQRDDLITANRQLDIRRHFTETILGAVSNGVLSIDATGHVSLCNAAAARLLHRDPDDVIGRPIAQMMPEVTALLKDGLKNDLDFIREEIQIRSREGALRHFLVQIAFEIDDTSDDHRKSAVMTFDDITDAMATQKKAAWADVARRIAHEIKNPLTPIQLSAERLNRKYSKILEEGKDRDTLMQSTDTIIRHVEDIKSMVNAFSTMAKMPEPNFDKANLATVVKQICGLHEHAPKAQLILDNTLRHQRFMCDEGQIRQALINLIKNASEATETQENPVIRVTISESDDGDIWLGVSDNGPGLPVEDKPRLSEPYVTHKQKGTGLGLAIVKKIAEDHGGRLLFDPAPEQIPGSPETLSGACVFMVLPLESV